MARRLHYRRQKWRRTKDDFTHDGDTARRGVKTYKKTVVFQGERSVRTISDRHDDARVFDWSQVQF